MFFFVLCFQLLKAQIKLFKNFDEGRSFVSSIRIFSCNISPSSSDMASSTPPRANWCAENKLWIVHSKFVPQKEIHVGFDLHVDHGGF